MQRGVRTLAGVAGWIGVVAAFGAVGWLYLGADDEVAGDVGPPATTRTTAAPSDPPDPATSSTTERPASTASPTTASTTAPPTADIEFAIQDYAPGDCLDWDPDRSYQRTDVVSCDLPHRVEIVGAVELTDVDAYPDDAGWDALMDERCVPLVEPYLGRAYDPSGRFVPHVLFPIEEGWDAGDHEVWCGLSAWSDGADGGVVSGRVADLDPSALAAVSSCWLDEPDGWSLTDCDGEHHYEVVGHVTVDDVSPGEGGAWDDAVYATCDPMVEAYGGRPVGFGDGDLSAWTSSLSETGWKAGAHSVDCVAVLLGDRGPAAFTGTLAAGGTATVVGG